jgi:hypothetical protein
MTRFAVILLVALAAPAWAQGAEQGKAVDPGAHQPPPGMCRIWINDVPADRQPAPTDCATAMRRRPSNARVIFGDEVRSKSAVPHLVEPAHTTEAQPTDTRTNDPRVTAPRINEPKTESNPNEPHAQPPHVQQPAAHPPVRLPPRTVVKPHKPSGPPMGRIRIH